MINYIVHNDAVVIIVTFILIACLIWLMRASGRQERLIRDEIRKWYGWPE